MEAPVEVKILLVDDTPANLITLEAVLDPLHYDTVRAHSGLEALEILKTTDISLIVLDVQMPQLDGFQTAKLIKQRFPTKDIPIIFMTAIYRDEPFVHMGYEMGGVDYFGKPFDPEILKAKVRLHAELFRKSKLLEQMDKKLKESDLRNRVLLDSVLDILGVTSLDGTLVYLNKAFWNATGYKPEEWIGKNFSSLVPPGELTGVLKRIAETVKSLKESVFETGFLQGTGRYLPVQIHMKPFLLNDELKGVICVARGLPHKEKTPSHEKKLTASKN